MLGDLFAEKASTKSNTRLQFKQSNINKEYINHLYILFKESNSPFKLFKFDKFLCGARQRFFFLFFTNA